MDARAEGTGGLVGRVGRVGLVVGLVHSLGDSMGEGGTEEPRMADGSPAAAGSHQWAGMDERAVEMKVLGRRGTGGKAAGGTRRPVVASCHGRVSKQGDGDGADILELAWEPWEA